MSFSGEVKEELATQIALTRHCQLAELSALIHFSGRISGSKQMGYSLDFRSENQAVVRKYFTLLRKTFNINTDILEQNMASEEKNGTMIVRINNQKDLGIILPAIKMVDVLGNLLTTSDLVNPLLLKNPCCRRAFLRGAYLTVGSMSDPEKSYHLEFVCIRESQANQLCNVLNDFNLDAKIVIRKKYFVVYMKEGSCIVDLLNIMEAHVSLMNLENLRILKEMRNSINRRVNCETANIAKTVNASSKQLIDIELIRDQCGLMNLPDNLREAAELRLEYPEATLKELGEYLNPPVGKSGMNHRLRKLSELADSIRG